MKKLLIQVMGCFLVLTSCGDSKVDPRNTENPEKPIDLKINDNDYQTFFVCEKIELDKLMMDLSKFGHHIDYKGSLYVDLYEYDNFWVVSFPKNFTVGQTAFLISWMNYGFCVSKSNINSTKDIFLYVDPSIIKKDFIAGAYRDESCSFKIDIVYSAFRGVNSTSYKFESDTAVTRVFRESIPDFFSLQGLKPIKVNFLLDKFKRLQPLEDIITKDNSVEI